MANRLFDLNETKGTFQVRGIVSGVKKDSFFVEKKTSTGKARRQINFGLQYENSGMIYITLTGMEQEYVYVSKREDNNTVTDKVKWEDRFSLENGFAPMGVRLGLRRITDEKNIVKNEVKALCDFDACKYVAENLKDGMSVFVSGRIEYSSFKTNSGEKRNSVKLVPTRIFLCENPIDFETEEKFINDFSQRIIFMGIEKEVVEDVATDRAIISAKVVSYSSIDDAEFILPNIPQQQKFLKNLRALSPYTSIDIFGKIVGKTEEDTVDDEDDGWGGKNPMTRVNRSYTREFEIIGAEKTSIDTTLYDEKSVNEAINLIENSKKADKDFGVVKTAETSDDWGGSIDINDEEDDW